MTKTYTVKSSATRAAKKALAAAPEGSTMKVWQSAAGWNFRITLPEAPAEDPEAPAVKKSKSGYIRGKSTAQGPCAFVWAIADAMIYDNPNATRKEIMAACMASGVTYGTARTQYQKWKNR